MTTAEILAYYQPFTDYQKKQINQYFLNKYFEVAGGEVYINFKSPTQGLCLGFDDLKRDPYEMLQIPGFGSKRVQGMMKKLPKNHPFYVHEGSESDVRAVIRIYANDEYAEGRGLVLRRRLLKHLDTHFQPVAARKDVPYDWATIKQTCIRVINDRKFLVPRPNRTYVLADLDKLWKIFATSMDTLVHRTSAHIDQVRFTTALNTVEQREQINNPDFKFSQDQINSAKMLLRKPISLLTGYAGTGKSTSMKIVMEYLRQSGFAVKLVAFSGKAADNLGAMVNYDASTVHRLINQLQSHPDPKLKYVVIDEIGMLGEDVLATLFSVLDLTNTRIIMLGDIAQLPAVRSVGALTGLLPYLNEHQIFDHMDLTHVYRQAGGSALLEAASALRNHQGPKLKNGNDLTYTAGYSKIAKQFMRWSEKHSLEDLGIITTFNKDADALNLEIQAKLQTGNPMVKMPYRNPTYNGSTKRNQAFYVGDIVMLTKNHYDVPTIESMMLPSGNAIMNGQRGIVTGLKIGSSPSASYIEVEFLDHKDNQYFHVRLYDVNQEETPRHLTVKSLSLAYAMTVHKAQGTTIPYTIYYVGNLRQLVQTDFVSVQLAYTAFTRAKKQLLVVFDHGDSVSQSILNQLANLDVYDNMYSALPGYLDEYLQP